MNSAHQSIPVLQNLSMWSELRSRMSAESTGMYLVAGKTGSAKACVAKAIVEDLGASGLTCTAWGDGAELREIANVVDAAAAAQNQVVVAVIHGASISGVRRRLAQLGVQAGALGELRGVLVTALTPASVPDPKTHQYQQTLLGETVWSRVGEPLGEGDWDPIQTLAQDLVNKVLRGAISRELFDEAMRPISFERPRKTLEEAIAAI